MSENVRPVPGIAWVAVCIIALAVGFYLGRLPLQPPANSSVASRLSVPAGDTVLTEHSISNIAKEASKWVVTLETEANRAEEALPEHVIPGLTPLVPRGGTGTGMIVRPDGYIVTANHVLGVDKKVIVILKNQKKYVPRIVGRDWLTDIAVLKIDAANLPCAKLSTSKSVEPGDWAIAIGTPMRLEDTVSLGIVSALGRTISDSMHPHIDLIQTDAAINPGNSGGPLLNIHGEVIGMNTAISRRAQNIAFAVPAEKVQSITDALIRDGRVDHGYLGLVMRDSEKETTRGRSTNGVYVVISRPNSSAARAGVAPGDVIEAVNELPVRDLADMTRIIMTFKAGERINLKIDRHGQSQSIFVPLDDPPAPALP